jgi:hypothetical protein
MRRLIRILIRKIRAIRQIRAALSDIYLLTTKLLLNTMLRLVIVSLRLLLI